MLTLPFTVAVFMVRSFLGSSGSTPGEAEVGRLTGGLAAFYSFSQFTLSYAWGIISSRYGRKVGKYLHGVLAVLEIEAEVQKCRGALQLHRPMMPPVAVVRIIRCHANKYFVAPNAHRLFAQSITV